MIDLLLLALLVLSTFNLYVVRKVPMRNTVLSPDWLTVLIVVTLIIATVLGIYVFIHMCKGDLTAFPLIALLIDMAFETYFVVRVWKGIW